MPELSPKVMGLLRPGLLLRVVSWTLDLLHPLFVLMTVAPLSTNDNEERAAQRWSCSPPNLSEALGELVPAPLQMKHS